MFRELKSLSNDHISTHNPYEDLYIYYIEGALSKEIGSHFGTEFLGNWVEEESSFLFFSQPSKELVQRILHKDKGFKLIDEFHFTYEEWMGGEIKPHKVSRFLIVPPWEECQQGDGELKMLLDPGVVFGTSLHPTTRDCLKALIEISEGPMPRSVLDLGTGTGIIAIGAVLLGAKRVLAVDNNPLAARTAMFNVKLNKLEENIEVKEARAEDYVDSHSDLLIANIHYDVIQTLIKKEGFYKKKYFILSGLMRSQSEDVKLELSRYPVEIVCEWDHESTWHTIMGRVRDGDGQKRGYF